MTVQSIKVFIDYMDKLVEKHRIVVLTEHMRKAPEDVRRFYFAGNLTTKFNSEYARKKRLAATNSRLGSINRRQVIVYRSGDEPFVEKMEEKHASITREIKAVKLVLKELEEEIVRLV